MAPAPRKTTGQSRTRKPGAASAVESTVEHTVDPVVAEENVDALTVDVEEAFTITEPDLDATQAVHQAKAPENEVTPEEASPGRDLNVLARLADTSGRSAVTPYPGDAAPSPVLVLPPLRDTHHWAAESDTTATARVLVDGWRVRINDTPRFAGKGDRVTAPADIIAAGIKRGSLAAEADVIAPPAG